MQGGGRRGECRILSREGLSLSLPPSLSLLCSPPRLLFLRSSSSRAGAQLADLPRRGCCLLRGPAAARRLREAAEEQRLLRPARRERRVLRGSFRRAPTASEPRLERLPPLLFLTMGTRPRLALYLLSACLLLPLHLPEARASYPPQSGECRGRKECSDQAEKKSDLRLCDDSTCRFGGVCRDDGSQLRCVCQFQCHKHYVPVCGSNGDTYQNECYRLQAACRQQRLISRVAEGPCATDPGSGSGDADDVEGSAPDAGRRFTKCSTCKYGAECDEDSEDVWCICNIDCGGHNLNPVCATDGGSYDNPCLVREASCMKQEQIDVKHLGRCAADKDKLGKKEDGGAFRGGSFDQKGVDHSDGPHAGMPLPCSDGLAGSCLHGQCEIRHSAATCRCDAGYKGAQCDEPQEFNVLYVVPSGQKLHYILIAAIIGAVQIAIIVAVVMCITRKCPKNNRGRRHKQTLGHFSPDTNSRMV